MAVPPKTFTATYSCDLSAYGSGISPVTVSSTVIVPATVPTVTPVVITLKTTAVTLPSSVLSQLSGVGSFDLTASVTAKQNGVSLPVLLSAHSAVSGTPTGLPASTATSSASPSQALAFPLPGTARIEVPAPTLKFTPHTASAALSPITCTTTTARNSIPVMVTDAVIGTHGPLYTFTETAGLGPTVAVKVLEFRAHVPMTITASGSRTTGKTDTVALVAGVGDIFQPGATSVRFSAQLPVTGAQPGGIALSKTITDVTSLTTSASGRLRLTRSGTDRVLVPEKFTYTYKAPVQGISGLVSFVWTCTLTTSPVPVGLTLDVTKGHTEPQPSSSPTATHTPTGNGGEPEGSGTPSGAPDTGGGTGPGADMVVAAGGAAIAVSGGGLVLFGRRRTNRTNRTRRTRRPRTHPRTPTTPPTAGTSPVAHDRYPGRDQQRGIGGGVLVGLGLALLAIGGFVAMRAMAGGDALPPASAQEIPATVGTAVPSAGNPADAAPPLPPSTPVMIEIPALAVRAPVMRLGLNGDGTVQVPPLGDRDLAGWYDGSVTPGQDGSSVVVGHVDNYAGPAVFYGIKNLVRGQEIDIVRADGTVAAFTVDGVQAVPKALFPAGAVYGSVRYPALRLVTCGGPFDPASGHYVDNIVVYAHLTGLAAS